MKKQPHPNTKAYLLRGAFYLILFVAVGLVPFALAQRSTIKQSPASTSPNSDNPASGGTWTVTGSLNTARRYHTQTLLPSGKVLVVGGYNDIDGLLSSPELYDPASGNWTFKGFLNIARYLHTATLLPNGTVLVAGGFDGSNDLAGAELYHPGTGTSTFTGSLNTGRDSHTATLLPNGEVLV